MSVYLTKLIVPEGTALFAQGNHVESVFFVVIGEVHQMMIFNILIFLYIILVFLNIQIYIINIYSYILDETIFK